MGWTQSRKIGMDPTHLQTKHMLRVCLSHRACPLLQTHLPSPHTGRAGPARYAEVTCHILPTTYSLRLKKQIILGILGQINKKVK